MLVDRYHRFMQSDWRNPVAYSVAGHVFMIALLLLVTLPTAKEAKEHVSQPFRLKGIKDLPTIAGKPGGGDVQQFVNPSKFLSQGKPDATVKDVSLQSLTQPPPAALKQIAVEVQPKKTELEDRLVSDGRDFQALLTQTQEEKLKDKVRANQKSTVDNARSKAITAGRKPGQEALIRFLQKPLAGLNLNSVRNVNIDPDEGMPGFTPGGVGGGGGGMNGSGSPGGFPDGLVGEAKQDILKYASLDSFLDIQVYSYQDPADSQKYFMVKILANKSAANLPVMPKEILFTIDCSLSIEKDRLDEFKKGIGHCLRNLNPDDVFNVIAFKDRAEFFAPKSVKATPETIKAAERFVSELTSNRATDVYGAFQKIVSSAPERRPSDIILISDGRPTHGVIDSRELINSVTRLNDKVRPVFAYSGGSKVNRYLLDFIAYQNRGWSQFVKERGKIHKGLGEFYAKIKDPIFINLRYQLTGISSKEVFPQSLPDFYRGAEFTLYGTYEDQKQFSMQLLGDMEGRTKELVFTRSFEQALPGGPDIMKGYAFNKIYYLISRMTAHGQDAGTLKEIQTLSQRYQVKTPYSPELAKTD